MQSLGSRTVVLAVVLLLIASLGTFVLYRLSVVDELLLPREQSVFPWDVALISDQWHGGDSEIKLLEASSGFAFHFVLRNGIEYPYISYAVNFTEYTNPVALVDWRRYDTLKVKITCSINNVLSLTVQTFDEEITDTEKVGSYRHSETFFACSPTPRDIKIDLTRLETPEWWFRNNNADYSKRVYDLGKVLSFSLHNSQQSVREIPSVVTVSAASLAGRDWRFLFAAIGLDLVIACYFAYLYLRKRDAELVVQIAEKIQQERPLIAYQQLPDDTKEDRTKNTVLRYMATHYANQELSLELAATDLGISRAKINEYLKDELGLTFASYINKLRLTEAARLLLEKQASVAEIAYKVGYSNPSYFATVFKKEYKCTPGEFRRLMAENKTPRQI